MKITAGNLSASKDVASSKEKIINTEVEVEDIVISNPTKSQTAKEEEAFGKSSSENALTGIGGGSSHVEGYPSMANIDFTPNDSYYQNLKYKQRMDRGLFCALTLIIVLCILGMGTSIGGAIYLKFRSTHTNNNNISLTVPPSVSSSVMSSSSVHSMLRAAATVPTTSTISPPKVVESKATQAMPAARLTMFAAHDEFLSHFMKKLHRLTSSATHLDNATNDNATMNGGSSRKSSPMQTGLVKTTLTASGSVDDQQLEPDMTHIHIRVNITLPDIDDDEVVVAEPSDNQVTSTMPTDPYEEVVWDEIRRRHGIGNTDIVNEDSVDIFGDGSVTDGALNVDQGGDGDKFGYDDENQVNLFNTSTGSMPTTSSTINTTSSSATTSTTTTSSETDHLTRLFNFPSQFSSIKPKFLQDAPTTFYDFLTMMRKALRIPNIRIIRDQDN